MSNTNLTAAKKAKNDEFYTQMSDIEAELQHYTQHFAGKVIYCNCDDPTWSNFWRYFHLNFEHFKLKKLIATHYDPNEPTYMMTYEGGNDADFNMGTTTPLQQNGDFRSPECIELLKEADIVVTNPPFSLFREYVAQLMEYGKKFVIIGSMNAVTYKEIFPLIRDNEMWLGHGFQAGNAYFRIRPEDARNYASGVYNEKTGLVKFRNCVWFTNLDIPKRHEPIDLIEHYSPERYPRYDNYPAINVNKTLDIPCDYDGVMGVPITMLQYYCPEQFEIVAFRKGEDGKDLVFTREREREFNRTFVSLYDVDSRDDQKCRRQNQWEAYLRTHNNKTKIEPIDLFFPNSMNVGGLMNNPKDTTIKGKAIYARILISIRKEKQQ